MHIFAPNHVLLVGACYPPSSALVTAGPDYKPNAQELSRLIYYASNRPGKLAKLSNELQKRVASDTRKAQYNNQRARASLLVTLNIFKALISECRRDMSLLSSSLMSSLDTILATLSLDLEVCAKVATVFVTWATYTDGNVVGVDSATTKDYMSVMRRFASMCSVEAKKNDLEDRNRTRLVGLGGLTGSITSNALYNSHNEFKIQVNIMVPALLLVLQQTAISTLDQQAEIIKEKPTPSSQYMSELRTRPMLERRAESIHIHVTGDKGPTTEDVANAALRAFAYLLSQSNGPQIGQVLRAFFDSIERQGGWHDVDHCCWFAQKTVDWTQFQYRFAVPTRLLERLSQIQEASLPLELHKTLIAMIKAVLTSPTPLLNMSTSDVMFNLITLLLRRVVNDPQDPLLLDLVDCIAALGTHIYYTDQINDLASELISRMTAIETVGIASGAGTEEDHGQRRSVAIKCLLGGLVGLMRVADQHTQVNHDTTCDSKKVQKIGTGSTPAKILDNESTAASPTAESPSGPTLLRRTNIPAEVWQDTLTLLCDGDFSVRCHYARSLVVFLRQEVVKETVTKQDLSDENCTSSIGRLPSEKKCSRRYIDITGTIAATRFLNALHVAVYVVATSNALGLALSRDPSPLQSSIAEDGQGMIDINIVPSTPYPDESNSNGMDASDASQQSQPSRRRSLNFNSQSRKVSMASRFLKIAKCQASSVSISDPQVSSSAGALDYRHILDILATTHEQLPCCALLSGVPMLIALDAKVSSDWTGADARTRGKLRATREVVLRAWQVIGGIWDCTVVVDLANQALSAQPSALPNSLARSSIFDEQEALHQNEIDSNVDSMPALDIDIVLSALSACSTAQLNVGMDEQTLRRHLSLPWNPESALKDSMEHSSHDLSSRGNGVGHVLKLSPALMHIENLSLQSLARSSRGVGVSDLRDALEGRGGMSNAALMTSPPSISSFDHGDHSAISADSRSTRGGWSAQTGKRPRTSGGSAEVRGVLDKLGIGAPNEPRTRKKSLPAPSRTQLRTSLLVPPYKT